MNPNNIEETVFGNDDSTMDELKAELSAQDKPAGKMEVKPWQKVAIGGTAGILLGVSGVYAAQAFASEEQPETEGEVEGNDAPAVEHTDIHMAHVSDSMSFSEAFAAARDEVGPGGTFVWHGGVYTTWYAEEWDAMSPEQKDAFNQDVAEQVEVRVNHVVVEEHTTVHHTTHHDDTTPDHDVAQHTDNHDGNHDGNAHPTGNTDGITVGDGAEDPEVRIIGLEETEIEGQPVTVGEMAIGDHDVIVVDVDHEGTFDVAMSDFNSNGEIEAEQGEVWDISGENVTVDEFQNQLGMTDGTDGDLYADNGDFVNDADVIA